MTQTHRFKMDKLIRDKLADVLRGSGIRVVDHPIDDIEYIKRLKDKLLEEAKEVVASKSTKELCEELADVYEVMLALVKVHGMDIKDVQGLADQKKTEKGGFEEKILTSFVEIEANNPSLDYYRSRPSQYPEIDS